MEFGEFQESKEGDNSKKERFLVHNGEWTYQPADISLFAVNCLWFSFIHVEVIYGFDLNAVSIF